MIKSLSSAFNCLKRLALLQRGSLQSSPQHVLANLRLQHQSRVNVAFFRTNWRNKEYMITNKIKTSVTSQELETLIKQKGELMNLINLTAILDRIEEQQMINTKQIVSFVIQKLKLFEYIFIDLSRQSIRPLCNIICYLGNIKNKELNYLFEKISYAKVIRQINNIEKSMLINGLIRLQLFYRVFQLKPNEKREDQLYFDIDILKSLNTNQLLSIWLAFSHKDKLNNPSINQIILDCLSLSGNNNEKQQITLKTYVYAFICYVQMYGRAQQKKLGRLHEIVRFQVPNRALKKDFLIAHQLSQFLKVLINFEKKMSLQEKKSNFYFSDQFSVLLNQNFKFICKSKNTTLRNIANIYTYFNQRFTLTSDTFKVMSEGIITILKEEIAFLESKKQYSFDFKVDSLSICSLAWKMNQKVGQLDFIDSFQQQFVQKIEQYFLAVQRFDVLGTFSVNELIMLYSGLYWYSKKHRVNFSPKFEKLSISLITKDHLKLNLKELTLFYTYFKHIKIAGPQICSFFKNRIQEEDQKTMMVNDKAEEILDKKGCLMEMGQSCKKCFASRKGSI